MLSNSEIVSKLIAFPAENYVRYAWIENVEYIIRSKEFDSELGEEVEKLEVFFKDLGVYPLCMTEHSLREYYKDSHLADIDNFLMFLEKVKSKLYSVTKK